MADNSKTPGRSVISKVSAILLTVAEDSRSTLTEIQPNGQHEDRTSFRHTCRLSPQA